MNGDALVARVRQVLKDVETDTEKGQFWDIREIVLALNEAQNIFIDYCLRNDHRQYLNGLKAETVFTTSTTMPSDYLHYMSAKTGIDEDNLKMARVYLGGEGAVYRYVHHNAAVILGEIFYFIDGTNVDANGVLYYYKRPAKIYSTELGQMGPFDSGAVVYDDRQDFEDYVYNDIIALHAAVIIGRKEVQTQRELKKTKRLVEEIVVQPKVFAHYARIVDSPVAGGMS